MATAEIKHVFPVAADQLWDLIGDFGNTGKWSGRPPEACVQNGEGIGALRTLTVEDGRQIVDRLDAVGEKFYSYSVVTSPLPVTSYKATMAVKPLHSTSSEFTWSGEFEPIGISDVQATAFFENVYRSGIAMMERTVSAMEHAKTIV
jgi:Polyketide cyclase / dehydrase and lipid transport